MTASSREEWTDLSGTETNELGSSNWECWKAHKSFATECSAMVETESVTSDQIPQADKGDVALPKPEKPPKKKYRQIELPTPEQMMQEEFMNNCATRTVLSATLGSVMGLFFGVLMGSMDGAVGSTLPPPHKKLHTPMSGKM
jgi:hypothetical protein